MENNGFQLKEFPEVDHVSYLIDSLRNGNTKPLLMYDDEYIKLHASEEDYAFWLAKKAELETLKRKTA